MGKQIEELAQFVAEARWEDVPEPVRRKVFAETMIRILGLGAMK